MKAWLNHTKTWWEALVSPECAGRLVLETSDRPGFNRFLVTGIILLYMFYGLSMGLFRGGVPAVVSGLKLPFLYLLTLIVCFPALYLSNCLHGPRLNLRQCSRLLLIAVSANAVALSSYAPFSVFFTLTTSRSGYGFLVLMHVVVFGLSGMASVVVISMIFRATAVAMGHRLGARFVMMWAILYAFVGTQMSWALRPWVGSWSGPYAPFRPLGGSFIEAVWRLLASR